MTPDEFFAWQLKQDKLYELVDGVPVLPLKMTTGASLNHDRVTVNAIGLLYNQLRGGPCRPTTDDVAIRVPAGNIRRPDVMVECGQAGGREMAARGPRLVLEVLSPSTMSYDRFRKVEEYKTDESLRCILLADTEAPRVTVYSRDADRWTLSHHDGLDGTIELPEIGATLALADLFEGLTFEAD
jgi:Uma2 family endonuclease